MSKTPNLQENSNIMDYECIQNEECTVFQSQYVTNDSNTEKEYHFDDFSESTDTSSINNKTFLDHLEVAILSDDFELFIQMVNPILLKSQSGLSPSLCKDSSLGEMPKKSRIYSNEQNYSPNENVIADNKVKYIDSPTHLNGEYEVAVDKITWKYEEDDDGMSIFTLVCLMGGEVEGCELSESSYQVIEHLEQVGDVARTVGLESHNWNTLKYEKFVQYLLDKEAKCSEHALANLASKTHNLSLIKQFIQLWKKQNGSDTLHVLSDAKKAQILHNAITSCSLSSKEDKFDILNYLHEVEGFDIHIIDDFGCNALFYGLDCLETTKYLILSLKVDYQIKNNESRTLIHEIASRCTSNIDVFRYLIQLLGPSVINEGDESGMTPLMLCVQSGSKEMARALLNHGASVHVKALNGQNVMNFNGMGYFNIEDVLDCSNEAQVLGSDLSRD